MRGLRETEGATTRVMETDSWRGNKKMGEGGGGGGAGGAAGAFWGHSFFV